MGLRIAEAVESAIPGARLRVVSAQQWAPEMAAELAQAELAIFVDASAADAPGTLRSLPVTARARQTETHRFDPEVLLGLAESLYGRAPKTAFLLTVGAGRLGYGEAMSPAVARAVPGAVRQVAEWLAALAAQ